MNTIGVSFLDPLDDYEIIQLIGSGTYGEVFKVRKKLLLLFLFLKERLLFANCTKCLSSNVM